MSDAPINNIWGWLLAVSAFSVVVGLTSVIPGIRGFMRQRRGPFSNLFDILFGMPIIGLLAFMLFVFLVPPTTSFYLQAVMTVGFLCALFSLAPFMLLMVWVILRQYSLPASAPVPRWLRRWIEQQKRTDAESSIRMKALMEARRQARAARRQA